MYVIIILYYRLQVGSEHLYAMCTESTSSVRLKIVSKHLKKLLKEHCVFTSRNTIYFTEFLLKNYCLDSA